MVTPKPHVLEYAELGKIEITTTNARYNLRRVDY